MATLILEDGSRFEGTLFGHKEKALGEVVFTTGMIGYQEIVTDPSYAGQIVCMTYPLIGNVGVNDLDYASGGAHMKGLVVSELCDLPSNWQTKDTLESYLDAQGVTALYGVDTRALTRHIRAVGAIRGMIVEGEGTQEDVEALKAFEVKQPTMDVTCKEAYEVGSSDVTVAMLDMGTTRAVVSSLVKRCCRVKVYPADTSAETILANGCDGVFISGGPGDPAALPEVIDNVKKLMDAKPTMGVCMGHLLMALAMGGNTVRMSYGHHGGNQPVKDLNKGTCVVTSQSHLYLVDKDNLPANAEISHINWNDRTIAGLRYTDREAFSVQFVPDGGKCPSGTHYLYDAFIAGLKK